MNITHRLLKHFSAPLGIGVTALFVAGAGLAEQPLPFNQAAVKQSTAPAALGPSASTPYFHVRFSLPIPPDNDGLRSGPLVGIDSQVADHHNSPAFEIMPNGDALMISFSGPSGREGDRDTLMAQARLRYGAEEFDMPEHINVGGKNILDLLKADGRPVMAAPTLLWREGSTVWLFMGGHQWQGIPQPPADSRPGGFRVFKSTDNGVTWEIVALEPTFSALSMDSQPIVNAFRAPNGDMFVATDGFSGAATSGLWRSSNGGLSWTDQGGRTSGRHSTIVPLNTSGSLLSLGGKDSQINSYMPKNTSSNWGATWSAQSQSPFPWLGANQRPSMIRLASGNLVMVGDSRFIHYPDTTPPGWTYGDAPYVALSSNNGSSWTIKALPVALKHESRLHKTIGYSTVRQAPNGVIHILAVNTHPCVHYELNEAWITTPAAGDIAPETTGGTVQSYSETYPGGAPKATWSARTTPGGRYLLDGLETDYYADGKKQREVTWASGRRTGPETLWGPDGIRIWSWNHDLANNVSTWTHWWSTGQKRLESQWDTDPAARDLSSRRFRGLVANGTARHWNTSGLQVGQYSFLNGDRIWPLGNKTETFATSPSGWTGSNNNNNGNNFGWSSTTSWTQNDNKPYMTDKGEIGGVFARSSTYRYYADTGIGTKSRTNTLRMSGVFRVANTNFDGTFRIGYFNTSSPSNNFIGLEIREPAGTILDPQLYGSGKAFRAHLTVNGPGGTSSSLPFEMKGSRSAFDLTWTGNPDGSGTLSGTVQSIPLPSITVAAGSGSFNAFGLLNGGMNSTDATQLTGSCWFDNLTYDQGTVTTYNVTYDANGATGGSVPSIQTKPSGVNIPVSANSGDLAKANSAFAGWNTAANGSGTSYAPGDLYTNNASATLYARWTAATTYTVSYNANGATGSAPANQIKVQNEALMLASNSGNLAKSGFAFAGWNTVANGTGTDYDPVAQYTGNASLTLYAKWAAIPTKTLKIMPLGDSITQGTIPGGYRLPLYNLLQGGGYSFDLVGSKTQTGDTCPDVNHWGQGGWQISDTPATIDGRSYVSIQGQNRSGIYDEMSSAISTTYFSTNTSTTRNIILLHIGINDVLHQVVDSGYGSFNTDAGTNGFGEGQDWAAEGMLARLQALLNSINSLAASRNLRIEIILGTLCPLTKAWTGDPVSDVLLNEVAQYNGFINSVIPTMSFSNLSVKIVDQNTATLGNLADGLHPNGIGYTNMAKVWFSAIGAPATCAVTFDAGSGTAPSPASKSVSVGAAYGTLATTTRSGYTFAGWWTATSGGGIQVTETTTVTNASNHSLYAKWTGASSPYTVTYDGNGKDSGSVPVDGSSPYAANATVTVLGNTGNLAKAGHTFAGWNTAANGSGTGFAPSSTFSIAANTTLYAQWAPVSSGSLYWDNTGGTANDWGNLANWSTVIGGGTNPTAIPGASDVALFSATPIQGAPQTVNLNGDRSVLGLTVLSGVTNTTLQGGGTDRTLTIGNSGIAKNGAFALTLGSGTAGQRVHLTLAGSQSIANNSSGTITINNNVSGMSSPAITNNGSGSGYVGMGALQATVGRIVQDSATSTLGLRANNSAYNGNVEILKGTVSIGTSANNLGNATSGQVILGGSGTDAATLEINDNSSQTYVAKPIVLGTASGPLKIVLRDDSGVNTHTLTGPVSGNNSLTLESQGGDDKLTIAGALNNAGTITHTGTGSGDLTVSSVIGTNVTGVIQNSATSRLLLTGTNTYTGDTVVSAGILAVNGNALPNSGKLAIDGGKVEPSGGTEAVGTLFLNGVQQAAGTWGSTASAATHKTNTYFTGTGMVSVTTGPATYTVTYDGNGKESGSAPVDGTSYSSNATVTVLGNTGNLAKSGYSFAGWNTAANGSGTGFAPSSTFSIAANTTLYAQWAAVAATGGLVTETFDTATLASAHGWTASGNTTNGNSFGWANTNAVLGAGTAGAAGGIFARAVSFSHYADTTVGSLSRTSTFRLAGSFRLSNASFDGDFRLGYFTPGQGSTNFVGLSFAEPSGAAGNPFRCFAGVTGTGGASTGVISLPQNTTVAFDLTWTGSADGSGTLSGTVAGTNMNVSVSAGGGNFTAFGLLAGGCSSANATQKTAGCHFDSLTYNKVGWVTETFDTEATAETHGWTASGNATNGHSYGWADTNAVLGAGTAGAAGGVFARAVSFSHYADTDIGIFARTATFSLAGSFRLANASFDGNFRLGYFTPGEGSTNFVGLTFAEPSGGAGNPFRGYAEVIGAVGAGTGTISLPQNTTVAFDLTWTGSADGSGTLSGTVAGTNVNVSVSAGGGNFTAFGLLAGGCSSANAAQKTAGCYFDSLTYNQVVSLPLGGTRTQTVAFGAIADQLVSRTLTLGATATSGLPVEYDVTEGPGVLDGTTLSFTGSGYVTVRATQGGSALFGAAMPVERRFAVLTAEGILDAGGNGADDRWELEHWPDSTPPGTVTKRGRAMPLRDVFVADLDPLDPDSVLEITRFGLLWKDAAWHTDLDFGPASTRRLYDLEAAPHVTGGWQRVRGDIVPDGTSVRLETPVAEEPHGFFRVQVRLPPPGVPE
jgi:uncharacterized repeat protein (TIGR02543 family)